MPVKELFYEYQHRMHAYAYAILRNTQDAEDVVQNVMIIALKKDHLQHHKDPLGWLLKATRFEALNHYRKHKRVEIGLDPQVIQVLEEASSQPEEPGHPLSDKIKYCLSRLKDKYQKMFKLRYEENIKGEALASLCGINKEAMFKALGRNQKILKQCLEKQSSE